MEITDLKDEHEPKITKWHTAKCSCCHKDKELYLLEVRHKLCYLCLDCFETVLNLVGLKGKYETETSKG